MRPRAPYLLWIGVAAMLLLCAVPGALAQLNEHCTVSVLNRTVQVNPDGSWVLPNVPANFGQVRARATCVENGITKSGQSDFFNISANRMNAIPPIQLGAVTPIPVSLGITPASVSFTTAGQTRQLAVTATYPDRSTKDVTAASTGTNYTTSNPALVTISADGLVTAVASGTVVIQATNDGAQGIRTVQVVLAEASHGGIPDSWAIAHGLDPNNPTMPSEDPDNDGLTNLQEFQNGTDPHNPDTDGDGLTDGQEVLTYHTNPLLADTDGDGIPDGVEVQTGTDPLNPLSFNLVTALNTIEVQPSTFVLVVNSIVGQASQQLTVLGHLIDGKTTINLTSTQKGTNYSSSNLTICNFGAPDGNVFAGSNGSCTITVTNSGHTANVQGIVEGFSPTPLSWVAIPGYANDVDVSGNFAYVASGSTGLQIVDVTDRSHTKVVSSVDTPGNGNGVQVVGHFAYVADGFSGLQIIDVTNPLAPVLVGSYDTPGEAWAVKVSAAIAYVADGPSGLQVIDVSNPAAPARLGSLALPGTTKGLDIDVARHLVVAVGNAGLFTINVVDPDTPALLGSLNYGGAPRDVAVQGNFAFVADFNLSLTSVDIANPVHPVLGTSTPVNLGGRLEDVVIAGNFAFGADVFFVNGVPIVDVSNAPALQPRTILNFPPGDSRGFRDDNATSIAADGAYVYFTAGRDVRSIDQDGVTGDTRLYIGQYMSLQDLNGIPPTASITAPTPNATVIQGSLLQITVQANDDLAVAAVNILVNGQVVFTATSAPYQFMYQVPANATTLTIGAQAVDFGNNVGTASPVTVTVIPDPLTTAQGQVVDSTNHAVGGAQVVCEGKSAFSAADGSFSIAGLSTIQGPIQCTATATIAGVLQSGVSAGVAPVLGGTTDVGTIVLSLIGSRGRDFWLAFESALQNPTAQLFIVSDTTANYTVSNSSVGLNVTGTVTSAAPAVVPIPNTLQIQTNQTVQNLGIHVTADADISVFFFYPDNVTADTYLGIPTPSLGTEYFALSYVEITDSYPSELVVVASQDATNVTISNACGAATPFSATLNQGQTYQLQCTDVSGAHVVSTKPVAVIAGVSCTYIPTGVGACDVISEMMFPVGRLWGTETYAAPLPGGGFDVYRVMAARDGTTVTVDQGGGNVQTLHLNQGQFQELHFKAGAHFTSNLPILVMQYMSGFGNTGVGDPFSMQLVPVTSFQQSFRFYAPPNQGWTNQAIIIAPNSAVGAVQLNGSAVSGFTPLPGGAYQYVIVNVPNGQNVVTSPQPITVYSIGFQFAGSYGSPTRF